MERFIDKMTGLPLKVRKLLEGMMKIREYRKGEFIFNESSSDDNIYYVFDGLLRRYIVKDGNEKTLDFYFTDDFYYPLSLSHGGITQSSLQAIDRTTTYSLSIFQFEKIRTHSIEICQLENLFLEKTLARKIKLLHNFQTMTARERYLDLIENYPEFVKKIQLTYLSSYLGINNASLSKIRSTLK